METGFKDEEWLKQQPLTLDSVMHYFSLSPYYDRQSNNEVVRMQTQFADARPLPLDALATTLASMTGLEYVVSHHQPDAFFVIKSRLRKSPEEVQDVAAFCVLGGVIFPLPSVYSVLQHRIVLAFLIALVTGEDDSIALTVHVCSASGRHHLSEAIWRRSTS